MIKRNYLLHWTIKWWTILLLISSWKVAFGVNEAWLFERYRTGDIDTIRSLLNNLPDSTAEGLFFKGVFEEDGEKARFNYDRIVALWPGSVAEAWALERLWQYHWSRGSVAQAQRYYSFLKQRHPDHPGLIEAPDFSKRSGIFELVDQAENVQKPDVQRNFESDPKQGRWRVQLGAFSRREGAKVIARKVIEFGPVDLIEKIKNSKKLTIVTAGRCHSRQKAQQLADEIQRTTGLKGIVIVVDDT